MPWTRMRYRNGKVWIETDDQGQVLVADGQARARYREQDTRNYSFKATDIRHLDGNKPTLVPRNKPTAGPGSAPKGATKPVTTRDDPNSPLAKLEPAADDHIEIYTDGATSGNPGPSGLGVVLRWGTHYLEVHQYLGLATNNIAELSAIKVALQSVHHPGRMPVQIHTDSQYSIGVLTGNYKVKANKELIEEIRALQKHFPALTLHKVKGHAGHPLNERADELARLAVQNATAAP